MIIFRKIALLAAGIGSLGAFGQTLPAPAAVMFPRANSPIEKAMENISRDNATWKRRWVVSLAPLVGSQVLDAHSSWGHRELNPLLADANGGFGMKAAGIKFGAVAAAAGVEYVLVKKYPRAAKFFTIVNVASAGVTSSLAVHNYNLR